MILATPIIMVESQPGSATRRLCDATRRLWHLTAQPAQVPVQAKPRTPARRWVEEVKGNYPVNPVLRARFGGPRSDFSGGLALVITLGLAALIGAGLASWAFMAQTEDSQGGGHEQMAELLPLSAPELGFEFDRTINTGAVPSDGNTALGLANDLPALRRNPGANGDLARRRVQPRGAQILKPAGPSVIADNPY